MSKNFKRFLSVILILILCISNSALPAFAVEGTDNFNEIASGTLPEVNEGTLIEAIEAEEFSVSDTFISYIDKAEFESHSFIRRLEEQEKLNTYVFENADRTRTVYYFDENLKYVDDNGQIVEKDLSLIESKNGYTIKKSDIDINLPNTPTSGINVGYGDFSISIIPISASKVAKLEAIEAKKTDGSVVYNGVFGENTLLVYTPMISGLKEDIVLAKYVPSATFSFTLKTNGLHIVEENGKYYLAQSEKSEPIFALGDVVAYDAVGKPSMGTMTVKTVKDGAEYVVTLEVDEEFLTDTTTVYPVTIDPSITISDNTNGAGAIEDAPIYQGYPDTNFGSYLFNPVGTPSADFGVGCTVVRLSGLISSTEYINTSSDKITNVTFYVKEGSGGGSQEVNIFPSSNTTWTESTVTWNNVGTYTPSFLYSATLSGGQWTGFNITNLVKFWKTNNSSANSGFVMASLNTANNSNFLSSEYPTTSYRPYVVMTYEASYYGGDSFENAENINLNTDYTVNINVPFEQKYFKFTPDSTGFFTFECSSGNLGIPSIELFNSSRNEIANSHTSTQGFRLTYHLISGVTYYVKAGCYSNSIGSYEFKVVNATVSSNVNVLSSLYMGSQSSVTISFPYEMKCYKFTPTVTGEYLFKSANNLDDPKAWLYDSSLNLLDSNDDGGADGDYTTTNFWLTIELNSNETYYLVAGQFASSTGNYRLDTYRNLNYVNYYDSSFASDATLLGKIEEANNFANYVYSNYFGIKMNMDGNASQYATIIDNCSTGMYNKCTDASCGVNYDNHHKNVIAVARQLFNDSREDNHVYVLWTDRDEDTYCVYVDGIHDEFRAIAAVCYQWPIIHFMDICDGDENVQEACMTLNLVHETAHTLGMPDVYDNVGHDSPAGTHCVMERFDVNTAHSYYLDVVFGYAEPFCSSCKQTMVENATYNGIEGN